MVPDGWEQHPIGDFLSESRIPGSDGLTADKITVKLYGKGVYAKDEKRLGSASTKYYKRQVGQFIYSKLDFLNGAFGIIPEELDGYESTLDLPTFDLSPQIDAQWLLSYVAREKFYRAHIGLAKGGRKARRVSPSEFLSIEIPFPPLSEQKKIADILSSVDNTIQATQAVIDQTRTVKQGLMQQLLTRGIGHTRFKQTEIGEIPANWLEGTIGDYLKQIKGGGTPSRKNSAYWGGTIPWASVKDLNGEYIDSIEEYITEEGLKNSASNLIPAGTVIIATRMALGKVIRFSCDVAINQDLKALFPQKELSSDFLFYWLLLQASRIEALGAGSTVKGIRLEALKALRIMLPPIDEQKKMVAILIDVDEVLKVKHDKILRLQKIKRGLMQDLLTGRVRVKLDGEGAT